MEGIFLEYMIQTVLFLNVLVCYNKYFVLPVSKKISYIEGCISTKNSNFVKLAILRTQAMLYRLKHFHWRVQWSLGPHIKITFFQVAKVIHDDSLRLIGELTFAFGSLTFLGFRTDFPRPFCVSSRCFFWPRTTHEALVARTYTSTATWHPWSWNLERCAMVVFCSKKDHLRIMIYDICMNRGVSPGADFLTMKFCTSSHHPCLVAML